MVRQKGAGGLDDARMIFCRSAQSAGVGRKTLAAGGAAALASANGCKGRAPLGLTVQSTQSAAPGDRARMWADAIAQTYFPLELRFAHHDRFSGTLSRRGVDTLSLSRLRTEPVQYERRASHIRYSTEEEFLVTLPITSPVVFRQNGNELRCDPGGLLIERGDAPYRFSYGAANDLYVMKLPRRLLRDRLRDPDRFCATVFDGGAGMGALFAQMLRGVHAETTPPEAAPMLAGQLLDLLVLAVQGCGLDADAGASSVRRAHLRRIDRAIGANLTDPALCPQVLADLCGISLRYLHDLCRDLDQSAARMIRSRRLEAARDRLAGPGGRSIAEIAYECGFSDQALFSRAFRAEFGVTPKGWRARQAEAARNA